MNDTSTSIPTVSDGGMWPLLKRCLFPSISTATSRSSHMTASPASGGMRSHEKPGSSSRDWELARKSIWVPEHRATSAQPFTLQGGAHDPYGWSAVCHEAVILSTCA
jgi:hypothetical protein